MRRVILLSPYCADNADEHIRYARDCVNDCLVRGEAAVSPALMFAGVLDGWLVGEQAIGTAAGRTWLPVADALLIFADYGISDDMRDAMAAAEQSDIPIEVRTLRLGADVNAA